MTTTNVLLQAQLDTILVDWNVKWKTYVEANKSKLTHPDFKKIIVFFEGLTLIDVYSDNSYSKVMDVHFSFEKKIYRLHSYNLSWELRSNDMDWGVRNSFSDLTRFKKEEENIFNDFLNQFDFKKIDKQLKVLKVNYMLKRLCDTHVGKVIEDVIDDGNLIKIKVSKIKETDRQIFDYNNFLNIGRVKEKLNEIEY